MTKPTKLQVILEVGAEGGTITVLGSKSPNGDWRFCFEENEAAIADLLSDEDLAAFGPRDFHHRSGFVDTFEDALELIARYPWHRLSALQVHPEFYDRVLAEVQKRGGDVERWKDRLSRHRR
jgi:hypothetical protein